MCQPPTFRILKHQFIRSFGCFFGQQSNDHFDSLEDLEKIMETVLTIIAQQFHRFTKNRTSIKKQQIPGF